MALRRQTVQALGRRMRRGDAAGNPEPRFAFFLGAGCSVTAGVPLGEEMTKRLTKKLYCGYSRKQEGAVSDDEKELLDWVRKQDWYPKESYSASERIAREYSACMAECTAKERQEFVLSCIGEAKGKINWLHIYLGQLVAAGYVKTILTTNFDNLALRAILLHGQIPFVCDHPRLADRLLPNPSVPQIVHLHGSALFYDMKNTQEEVAELDYPLMTFIDALTRLNGLVVVGYRGEESAVMSTLSKAFEGHNPAHGLYWVSYAAKEEDLSKAARDLMSKSSERFWIPGEDADGFFQKLVRGGAGEGGDEGLGLGLPPFLTDPLRYLQRSLDGIPEPPTAGASSPPSLMRSVREQLEVARRLFESPGSEMRTAKAQQLIAEAGARANRIMALDALEKKDYEKASALVNAASELKPDDEMLLFAQAYVAQDWAEWLRDTGQIDAAVEQFREATEKYAAVVQIKPDKHEAFYNWGIALAGLARVLQQEGQPDAAQQRFREAGEKCAAAVQIKPDEHEAFYNWGYALAGLARLLQQQGQPDAAQQRFLEAGEKYAAAVQIKPDEHEAFNNWGLALAGLARLLQQQGQPDAAQQRFLEAGEKYAATVQIKPDKHEAFYSWGNALAGLARLLQQQGQPDAAQQRFLEAGEKYAAAVQIKPDEHEAFYNWGIALAGLARLLQQQGQPDAAQQRFLEAGEKYAAAVQIKPDMHEAFNNWGYALAGLARLLQQQGQPDAAQQRFLEAAEKYPAAVQIKPDEHEAFYNWGIALAGLARLLQQQGQPDAAQQRFLEAGEKYAAAVQIKPDMHEAFNNWGYALAALARLLQQQGQPDAAQQRFLEANEKYAAAVQIKPDKYEAFYNWGNAL